jgi:arylsulfatase A-like enzyme
VDNPAVLSTNAHLTTILQSKAEAVIYNHSISYPDSPLFLCYALENNHADPSGEFGAPDAYIKLCSGPAASNALLQAYCALNLMADEAIGDTVCALEAAGFADNLLLVVGLGDNGGWGAVPGSNYPYRGAKGTLMQGGIHNRAFIYGSMIPLSRQGGSYGGLVHITDWYPTFLSLASAGAWTTPYTGDTIDGHNVLQAIIGDNPSPRTEIFHNYAPIRGVSSMQIGFIKYVGGTQSSVTSPASIFVLNGTTPVTTCSL